MPSLPTQMPAPFLAGARRLVKSGVESILGSRLARAVAQRRVRGARLILAYHNIIDEGTPPSHGDRSLHLRLDQFRLQLDCLAECSLRVVPLDAADQDADDTPRVSITFDDASAGAVRLAVPELAARGLPATIFVAPGILGLEAPWWDRLADPAAGQVPPRIRQVALDALGGSHEQIMAAARTRQWSEHEVRPSMRIASEDELEEAMASHPTLTLGAHSWGHVNLTSRAGEALRLELRRPLGWLRDRWGDRCLPWLAYPYGLETPALRSAVASAGYRGALLIDGGWHRRASDRMMVPRLNVAAGLSHDGFRARLAGF